MSKVPQPRTPVYEEFGAALADYRKQVGAYMLDDTMPFYERLSGLFAVQRASETKTPSNGVPAIEHLRRAANGSPLLVDTLGGLVLGYLDSEKPWDVAMTEYRSDAGAHGHKELGLVACFAQARFVRRDYNTGGVMYEGGGMKRLINRHPAIPDTNEMVVALDGEPCGHENFAARISMAPEKVAIGWGGIHTRVESMAVDELERFKVQVATLEAVAALGEERGRLGLHAN